MLLSKIPAYFRARRDSLTRAHPGAAFIFPSNEEMLRNPDVHYPFRQESNFFYLSGFEEPNSVLVLTPEKKTVLFVRRRNPEKEMWEGERYGLERAQSVFGADEAYPFAEFTSQLPRLLGGAEKVFYRIGQSKNFDPMVLGSLEMYRSSLGRSGKALPPIVDPNEVVGEMRMFKTDDEALLLRRACEITAAAHKIAMKETRPGMNEGEIEALVNYQLRKNGCQREGYGSIIAGGKNATCLHYRANNEELRDGDLLLIDAGGEYDYYTSDITRTFPVGKKFTKPQAKLYDLVLNSQKDAIAMAKPGATLPAIHKHVCEVLIEGMLSLNLLKGSVEENFNSNAFKRFFPHGTSHWLGMDVHDVGLYTKAGEPRKLEPGMCFTIEPGFYVQPGDKDAPDEFRNIGIRIEDDVLITAKGCEVLTQDAPKEREEIEALRA